MYTHHGYQRLARREDGVDNISNVKYKFLVRSMLFLLDAFTNVAQLYVRIVNTTSSLWNYFYIRVYTTITALHKQNPGSNFISCVAEKMTVFIRASLLLPVRDVMNICYLWA